MNPYPTLLSDEVLARADKLSSTLLCDGMKALGIPKCGCMDASIHAVEPFMKVIGTAMTIETSDGDNFPIHVATYNVPQEGYVMVIDGKGYASCAYIGELIMGAAQAIGYKGLVIDGYTRDRHGNAALRFPAFSRGLCAAGPIKKNPGEINAPIQCGGVSVQPGDLIFGDADGVCVVPRERIAEVLDNAEEKLRYEEKRTAAIAAYREKKANGETLPQLAPQWVLDLLNQK